MTNFEKRKADIREEIWKPVIGYRGKYEVSNFGRVRTLSRKYNFIPTIMKLVVSQFDFLEVYKYPKERKNDRLV